MEIYTLSVTVLWLILLTFWAVTAVTAKKTIRNGGWRQWFLFRIFFIILVTLAFHSQIIHWSPGYRVFASTNQMLGLIGVLVTAIGVAFSIWARMHLGRNWGMPMSEKKEPELVTSGPYASVRHPIYAGILIAALGSALVVGPIWLLTIFIIAVYFIYSAIKEETHLMAIFPTQYPEYKKRTKMLIPFVF
ncbi:MAG TPA: isoprenylcysteine carboxylmethyltransferase family protein [Candidatus Peribacteraceae bacterium]|nr:isoprenylcysteine carboxylmethyltransferase family protein [Candidatus Peribacteraceae bacterium]